MSEELLSSLRKRIIYKGTHWTQCCHLVILLDKADKADKVAKRKEKADRAEKEKERKRAAKKVVKELNTVGFKALVAQPIEDKAEV